MKATHDTLPEENGQGEGVPGVGPVVAGERLGGGGGTLAGCGTRLPVPPLGLRLGHEAGCQRESPA